MHDDRIRSRTRYEGRARWYDLANRLAALMRGTSATSLRRHAIAHLRLPPGACMLEVSVGTGTNARLIWQAYPHLALLAGIDISRGMLERCAVKAAKERVRVALAEADALHLPFRDGTFDAVFHYGGLAEFGDRASAIAEMARVAKAGSRIVICDLGVPAEGRASFINRMMLKIQPAYRRPPPTDELPTGARDVATSWFGRGSWYLVEFTTAGGRRAPRPPEA